MIDALRKIWADESGQVLPVAAAMAFAFVLLLLGGVAVGDAVAAKTHAQAAADAAALAGVTAIMESQNPNTAVTAAAQEDGYSGVTGTQGTDPTNNSATETVTVNDSVTFAMTFKVSATAKARLYNPTDPYNLLTLSPTSCLTEKGSGNLDVTGGMFANGGYEKKGGSGSITAAYTGAGQNNNSCWNYDTSLTQQPQQPDPLAGATAPPLPPAGSSTTEDGVVHYSPGYYPSGISETGSNTVVFEPGVYYMGGGLTVGGSTSATGDGVMFYFPSSDTTQGLTEAGSATLDLSAPTPTTPGAPFYTDMPYGIVFWDAGTGGNNIKGGDNFDLNGSFYAPNDSFTMDGNVATNINGQLLADTFTMNGDDNFNVGTNNASDEAQIAKPELIWP